MADTLLISDLHLSPQRPGGVRLFLRFLEQQAPGCARLYILGDLFDAWIGDDYQASPIPEILAAIRALVEHGTPVSLMHGNRDFLIGEGFVAATGCTLIDDPATATLGNVPTLLMHGDLLCSDDSDYQQARRFLRDPAFISELLSKPVAERLAIAAEYRKRSGEAMSLKAADIMDVNQQTVEQFMREYRVSRLIHGHTHRPGVHRFQLDSVEATRYVLGEWDASQGSYLRVGEQGVESVSLA